jgi:hypothetical protein
MDTVCEASKVCGWNCETKRFEMRDLSLNQIESIRVSQQYQRVNNLPPLVFSIEKEANRLKQAAYYQANKESAKSYAKEQYRERSVKTECGCGSMVTPYTGSKHLVSDKHLRWAFIQGLTSVDVSTRGVEPAPVRVTCECGATVIKCYLKKHRTAPIHKKHMETVEYKRRCQVDTL